MASNTGCTSDGDLAIPVDLMEDLAEPPPPPPPIAPPIPDTPKPASTDGVGLDASAPPRDGGPLDAGIVDAAPHDAASGEAGPLDAGRDSGHDASDLASLEAGAW